MSSLRTKHTVHSSKFAERKRREIVIVFFLCSFCAILLLTAFILLVRSGPLQIMNVNVVGTSLSGNDLIANAAHKVLTDGTRRFVPDTSILFFSKSKIATVIASQFPNVKDFSISRTGFSQITISIYDRTPVAIVCTGFRDEEGNDDCLWSDERGFVFSPVASTSMEYNESTYNHYYVPGGVELGKYFLEEKIFRDLEIFMKGAVHGGLETRGILIGENGQYEMYIKNRNGASEATVYFDNRAPFDATLENLLTFWQNGLEKKKSSLSSTSTSAINYINLRFGNTVYYSTE